MVYWLLPIVAILAIAIGFLLQKFLTTREIGEAKVRAKEIVEKGQQEAENKRKDAAIEAKELLLSARTEAEKELREKHREIQQVERRALQKDEQLTRRLDQLDRRDRDVQAKEKALANQEKGLKEKEDRYHVLLEEQRRKLEAISGLTQEEAKRQLLAQMEEDARREATLVAMRLEEEAKEQAERKGREVLATTIARLAPDYVVETAVSIVVLPSDDMKGRIIGREGRNIRALEHLTGVDFIIDDTPQAVVLSSFDGLRREIAKLTLTKLIEDGRIHPARIEESYYQSKAELEDWIR